MPQTAIAISVAVFAAALCQAAGPSAWAAVPAAAEAVGSPAPVPPPGEEELMGPPAPLPPAPEPLPSRELTLERVYRALWYPGRRATFAPTTGGERRVFRRLLPGLLLAAMEPEPDLTHWQALAAKAGFRLELWTVEERPYWALVEQRDLARGAGAYIIRPGPPAPSGREVVLQAPHAYFDRHTGVLLARIFFDPPGDTPPRAFFTNTIQRYRGAEDRIVAEGEPEPRPADADVCHNRGHLFVTASVAAASTLGRVTFLQVHGFGDASIPIHEDGLPVHAVISAGYRRRSTDVSRAVAFALQDVLGPSVRRYPEEVRRLGGTLNVIGRRLRPFPAADFVHLELAFVLRRQLRGDDALLADVGRALLAAAANPTPLWPGAEPPAPAPEREPASAPAPEREPALEPLPPAGPPVIAGAGAAPSPPSPTAEAAEPAASDR